MLRLPLTVITFLLDIIIFLFWMVASAFLFEDICSKYYDDGYYDYPFLKLTRILWGPWMDKD